MAFQKFHVQFPGDFKPFQSVFALPRCYAPTSTLGRGSASCSIIATDSTDASQVVIKKIQGPENCGVEGVFANKNQALRVLRELAILKHMSSLSLSSSIPQKQQPQQHPNILGFKTVIPPASGFDSFKDIYMVFDYMPNSLQDVLYAGTPLSASHHKAFLLQILRGLSYLHSSNILHRDIKPSNVSVDSSCHAKLADFGLSRDANPSSDSFKTPGDYVTTLSYRAPELLLGATMHTSAVDIWSAGIIMMQLISGRNPFAASSVDHTLINLARVLGIPSENDFPHMNGTMQGRLMMMETYGMDLSSSARAPIGLEPILPLEYSERASALDLLSKMLVYDPRLRISATEALQHPFLADPAVQHLFPLSGAISPPIPFCSPLYLSAENQSKLTSEDVRILLYEEIRSMHPEASFAPITRTADNAFALDLYTRSVIAKIHAISPFSASPSIDLVRKRETNRSRSRSASPKRSRSASPAAAPPESSSRSSSPVMSPSTPPVGCVVPRAMSFNAVPHPGGCSPKAPLSRKQSQSPVSRSLTPSAALAH